MLPGHGVPFPRALHTEVPNTHLLNSPHTTSTRWEPISSMCLPQCCCQRELQHPLKSNTTSHAMLGPELSQLAIKGVSKMTWVCWKGRRQPASTGEYVCVHMRMRRIRHQNLQCGPGGWRARKTRHRNPQCGPEGWGARKTRHGNLQCGPGGWRTGRLDTKSTVWTRVLGSQEN